MSADLAALCYLVAGALFILALRGLSNPETSRRGNQFGMVGMAIAIATTLAAHPPAGLSAWVLVIAGMALGGGAGAVIARRVPMTSMPELVAAFHSLVGMAAVLVAAGALYAPAAFDIGTVGAIHGQSLIEMSLGVAIGAITFTGSIIAFLKLSGRMSGAPILLPIRHVINVALALSLIALIVWFFETQHYIAFWLVAAASFLLGVLLIIPIGGADMPVVISMLNSYSGWAAAGIGFTLGNSALIITGALVGSSGAILSYIMCKGMNRSFISVILGGFGGEVAGPAAAAGDRPVKIGSAEDAAFILKNAGKVIIVPGYGMAVAQAQHALREMGEKLKAEGVEVKYAIHPVAGRMPGHMNVLLAEANVPYDEVFELGEHQFGIRAGRRRLCHRRQRRDQSRRRRRSEIADLRHAGAASVEGRHRHVQQALAGVGLCRHRQSAVLPRQHHDAARRRQENDGRNRQVGVEACDDGRELFAKTTRLRSARGAGPGRHHRPCGRRPYRLALRLIGIPAVAVAGVLIYSGLRDHFVLPECDSARAKKTLTDVLKQLQLEPVRYEPIKTVSSSKDEIVCNATLPLPDGADCYGRL